MINSTLYLREMKKSVKMLIIFGAVITMYVTIIIGMYDPEMMKMLDGFAEMMPELMAAVGMDTSANTLLGFMVSYLYGFIFLIFPSVEPKIKYKVLYVFLLTVIVSVPSLKDNTPSDLVKT